MNSGDASRQPIFNLPEDTPAKIDVMFHQPHPTILGPTLPIIVPNNILIIWIRVLGQVSLN